MIRRSGFPEPTDNISHIANINPIHMLPLPWEQQAVFPQRKTVIQKKYHTLVLSGPDYPSGRLQDFIHSRETVGIVKASLFPGSITDFYSLTVLKISGYNALFFFIFTFLAVFGFTASANCDFTIA